MFYNGHTHTHTDAQREVLFHFSTLAINYNKLFAIPIWIFRYFALQRLTMPTFFVVVGRGLSYCFIRFVVVCVGGGEKGDTEGSIFNMEIPQLAAMTTI